MPSVATEVWYTTKHMFVSTGARVRRARLAKDMNQFDLGTAAGVQPTLISRIENDHGEPTIATLRKLAQALEVPVGELVGNDDG